MADSGKTREELMAEVQETRCRLAMLEASEAENRQARRLLQDEQQLLRESLESQERDRRLVTYELHDGIAQQLAGALLQLQAFGELEDRNSEEAQRTFDAASKLISDSLGETRRLISGLQPSALDEVGVVAAIDCLIREMQGSEEPEIEFVHNVQFDRLSPSLEPALFRIAQEALNNACRHSRSKKVCVTLAERDGHVRVEVQDWGAGFDPGAVKENSFGLRGIRERARVFAGQANVDTAPGRGTRVIVELPSRS